MMMVVKKFEHSNCNQICIIAKEKEYISIIIFSIYLILCIFIILGKDPLTTRMQKIFLDKRGSYLETDVLQNRCF